MDSRSAATDSRRRRNGLWILALACLALWIGCGKSGGPTTVPVAGKVTCQGQPLTTGTVTFVPTAAKGRPASGDLQADGTYRLSSFSAGDGAMPGDYKVVVVSLKSGPTLEKPRQPEVSAVPKKYAASGTTDLTATVKAGENREFNFDLK